MYFVLFSFLALLKMNN